MLCIFLRVTKVTRVQPFRINAFMLLPIENIKGNWGNSDAQVFTALPLLPFIYCMGNRYKSFKINGVTPVTFVTHAFSMSLHYSIEKSNIFSLNIYTLVVFELSGIRVALVCLLASCSIQPCSAKMLATFRLSKPLQISFLNCSV